jgi:hypothetical protein
MRYTATITRTIVSAAVLLTVLGATPGVAAAAPSPSQVLQGHDLAVFEWNRLSQVNSRVSDQRLGNLRADGFTTVYADVSEYLEVADQPPSRTQRSRLSQLNTALRQFVARASSFGLAVHAVGGGPTWTDPTRRYLGPKLVQLVADYNTFTAAGPDELLQGVQLDIEPYVLDSFWDDVDASLKSYLTTLEAIVDQYRSVKNQEDNLHLRLGFAIPFWFDGVPDVPAVQFGSDPDPKPAAFHLIDMLHDLPDAYVLVMAYRNFAAGTDGSIEHVQREFAYATGKELDYASDREAACGIVVGQEFGRVEPRKLSFWWTGRAAFWREAEKLVGAYGHLAQFRGLSVNDLNAYQAAPA